ncbi:MAG: hypothetical protein JRH20_06435 [Deltaproteobacteria bacterium]|nr:hypothetical protein [Deltaproteobacteria bacterium]
MLDLQAGPLAVEGDTSSMSNEYGGSIRCGGGEGLVGPQLYYSLQLEAGRAYRLKLEPSFDASVYLFSSCNIDVINADCSQDDGAGARLPMVRAGEVGTLVFWPDASGFYEVAVDSLDAALSGSFVLTVEAFEAAAESRCEQARDVVLEPDGVGAVIHGVTLGGADEFEGAVGCKTGLAFAGAQSYFSIELQGGKSYRLQLEADFSAALYAFSAAANCNAENIQLDCGGIGGTVLLPTAAQNTMMTTATRFTPSTSGRYVLAVDSLTARQAGEFTLRMTPEAPTQNEVCTAAQPLSLVAGYVELNGETQSLLNDRGALLQCTGRPLLGPQRYYRVALDARRYQVRLKPQFDAVLALGQSCQLLPVDCQSAGLTGNAVMVPAGTVGSLSFAPDAAAEVIIAVDSVTHDVAGLFTLEVIESVPPENGVCTAPATLSVGSTLAGETGSLGLGCRAAGRSFAEPRRELRSCPLCFCGVHRV